jgi:hypothetical protein
MSRAEDSVTGVWETTLLLGPEQIEEDRPHLVSILNGLPEGVSLTSGTYVLPSGRIWSFRMLATAVVV